jgi:tRNA threonylcarbamoyladenosine biosynthesis protein TsaB
MTILAIDTCLAACSAAVLLPDGRSVAHVSPMDRGQAEALTGIVQGVLAEAGVAFADVTRIGVTTGPGSFTGARVGLAFARALRVALGAPCVGVSTLRALALNDGTAGLRAAVIETPGALYLAVYADGAVVLAPQAAEKADAASMLVQSLGSRAALLTGPGAERLAAAAGGSLTVRETPYPDPVALARLAAAAPEPEGPPAPTYLRAALLGPPP